MSPSGPGQGLPACTEQLPPPQVSPPLQNRPSLHGAVLFGCWQTALAPLQVSLVQTLPSSVHAVPFVLNVQLVVQHEPAVPLLPPSSHCSDAAPQVSIVPLPHRLLIDTVTKWPSFAWLRPPKPG